MSKDFPNPATASILRPVQTAGEFYKLAGDFWRAWSREQNGRLLGLNNVAQRMNGGVARLSLSERQKTLMQISAEESTSPETIALSFFRTDVTDGPAAPDQPVFIQGIVSWGAGKSRQSALFDIHRGTRLTLDCSSVEVTALMTTTATIANEVEVGVGCVFGSLVRLRPLTLSIPPANLIAGGAALFIPPPFARDVTVWTPSTSSTYLWRIGKTVGHAPLSSAAGLSGDPARGVMIPNGAESLSITNTSGVAADYQLIWGLDL